jgi:hypothetical protein
VSSGITKSEERSLRAALARYEAISQRKSHWGWTREYAEIVREIEAIKARLNPTPVHVFLDRAEKLCPQFELILRDVDAREAAIEVVG